VERLQKGYSDILIIKSGWRSIQSLGRMEGRKSVNLVLRKDFSRLLRETENVEKSLKMISRDHVILLWISWMVTFWTPVQATEIQALLTSDNQYLARSVSTDPKKDLAMIQIPTKESLPHMIVEDSNKMEVGERAVALLADGAKRGHAEKEPIKVPATSIKARLGVDVRPITYREVQRYGLDTKQGVVIIWIDPNGPLARVGFEVKDVILEINGRAIGSLEDYVDLVMGSSPEQQIILLALDHRSGRTGYVQVVIH